ncbi:MAG: hypothetical protein M1370_10190 [Bacteroidetes bacterium]|nr:hypothetical protein [Bacteroidota bacterium]MCL5026892.1 hypothetical protein [Chloroflexota bacterium]
MGVGEGRAVGGGGGGGFGVGDGGTVGVAVGVGGIEVAVDVGGAVLVGEDVVVGEEVAVAKIAGTAASRNVRRATHPKPASRRTSISAKMMRSMMRGCQFMPCLNTAT